MTAGKKWAKKTPADRVKLFRMLSDQLTEMARELGDAAEPGEVRAIHIATRTIDGIGARVQSSIDFKRADTSCCLVSRTFGSCECLPKSSACATVDEQGAKA